MDFAEGGVVGPYCSVGSRSRGAVVEEFESENWATCLGFDAAIPYHPLSVLVASRESQGWSDILGC